MGDIYYSYDDFNFDGVVAEWLWRRFQDLIYLWVKPREFESRRHQIFCRQYETNKRVVVEKRKEGRKEEPS